MWELTKQKKDDSQKLLLTVRTEGSTSEMDNEFNFTSKAGLDIDSSFSS